MTPGHIINMLKEHAAYFAAGALARTFGHDDNYGCHFGMRSTRDMAARLYKEGWLAAQRAHKEV